MLPSGVDPLTLETKEPKTDDPSDIFVQLYARLGISDSMFTKDSEFSEIAGGDDTAAHGESNEGTLTYYPTR